MMKSYKVRLTAYVETTEIVEAENEEQACRLVEDEWAESFVVYNTYTKEPSSFDDILAYEPEEIK
jgi:hypothetical protein